jgi:TonB-linked SusC/RagA family outer membrane protein
MMRIQKCAGSLPGLLIAAVLFAAGPSPGTAQGTGTIQGRVVEAGSQRPLTNSQVIIVGTSRGMLTNQNGEFLLPGVPAGTHRVRVEYIGFSTIEQTVRLAADGVARADFALEPNAISLDAVVVTALGQEATKRSLGTAQQTVRGADIAQAQRENFVNALQGRVAGLEVVSNSGVPGASSQIIVRGVGSISGNNSPLIVIDGLPVDNKVVHSNQAFVSQFENRSIDFTNRASDFNPEDIETLTVLKGPEAAALYGIDAANGAIVITTKRGRAGTGGFEYSNSIKVDIPGRTPTIQNVYGPNTLSATTWGGTFAFFGEPYPDNAVHYNNVDGFFRNALTQRHNLSFSGASDDSRITYRLSAAALQQRGVIPTTKYDRYNVTASSQATATSWLRSEAILQYSTDENSQPWKGAGGPLLGLLAWPDTIDAKDWLTPEGQRKRITTHSAGNEVDNPYFSVNRNRNLGRVNRINANVGVTLLPVSWGNLKTNIGIDNYSSVYEVVRHPESQLAFSAGGVLDQSNDATRNISTQTLLTINPFKLTDDIGATFLLGQALRDSKSDVRAGQGTRFLDPNFVSINNTVTRSSRTYISQRRLLSGFGQATFDYKDYLFLTLTGRNDWTSTIPKGANSFFYPSVSTSFIFSDAFPSVSRFMTGKLRAAWAEVGKDARPYAYAPSLEYKTTSHGGFGAGFTGPNPNLKPEFATSMELGTELAFFGGRMGIDATVYRKETRDQIVENVRASYGSGYILINLNGAETRSEGLELAVRGTPVQTRTLSWDLQANFTRATSKVLRMPSDLPEFYSSDTWLVGNVRNGVGAGLSTMALTGLWYQRNQDGDLLIEPTTGLPLRESNFRDGGYDRQPDFMIGLHNRVNYRRFSLSALLDIRKGGDVFNATEWWLTQRGLSERTLDRWEPRVVQGVLRDGKENTANPTPNTIVVVPALNNTYYSGMSEELFIEKDINWLRLRDVTLSYMLPSNLLGTRSASVFVTATELFLLTNYSGADPIVNGNTAATGGSGGIGVDYGNFPMPIGLNFGVRVGF